MNARRARRLGSITATALWIAAAGCKGPALEGRPRPLAASPASGPAAAPALPTATSTAHVDAPATASAPAEIGPSGKVLAFGDSITQGDWRGQIAPSEKWVARLGAKSSRISVVNAGKNGRTTGALRELGRALAENADVAVVILFLGVNDMKNASPGVVERVVSNMGAMIDRIKEEAPAADIVLCAPTTINVATLESYWREHEAFGEPTASLLRDLSVAYEALARAKGVQFINLLGAVSPENIEDGVHPNAKGQAEIADAIWRGLTGAGAPTSAP